MRIQVSAQLLRFGQSILLGLGLALLYDLLRPLRRRGRRLTALLDGAFCLAAGLTLLLFALRRGAGELRLYCLLGAIGGAALQFTCFSPLLAPVWDFWAQTAEAAVGLALLPVRLLGRGLKKVEKFRENLFYFWRKWFTIRKGGRSMAKAAKGRKVASGFPVRLAILALLVLLGWQVWRMQDQLTAAKAQEQQLRQQVQTQQQENDALQKSIDQGGSREEMERIARDELGLVSPGERVFVDIGR